MVKKESSGQYMKSLNANSIYANVFKVSPSSIRARENLSNDTSLRYITRNIFEVMIINITYFLIFFVFQQI